MVYKLPLALEPQPEGGYVVTCPVLPELITEGDTLDEAVANANDALAAISEAYEDLKRPLPLVLQPMQEKLSSLAGNGSGCVMRYRNTV